MGDFLKYFNKVVRDYPMHLEIYYSKITEWSIRIWRKGCGENGKDIEIFNDQGYCNAEYLFAKAHVALVDWLSDNEGWS